MLTTALCFLYLSMRPPVPPNPELGQDDPGVDLVEGIERKADTKAAGDEASPDMVAAESDDGHSPAGSPRPNFNPSAYTLGSMDPERGFNLLITLASNGAGIEHVELVEQDQPGRFRYRALEHEGGYLGYLGLGESPAGPVVRTVPDGSPAARAQNPTTGGGIQPGDILQEIDGASTPTGVALGDALEGTKPGQIVNVGVLRDDGDGGTNRLEFQVKLSEAPLDILRTAGRVSEIVPGNLSQPSLRTTLGSLEAERIPPGHSVLPALQETLTMDWEGRRIDVAGGEGVEFRLPLDSFLTSEEGSQKLTLVKRYRLYPTSDGAHGYTLEFETRIENHGDAPVTTSFRQEGLNGLTLEGWWYSVKISPSLFAGAGQRDVIYNSELDTHKLVTTRQILDRAKSTPDQPHRIIFSENEPEDAKRLRYIGLDSQYFNASLLPMADAGSWLTDLRQAGTSAVANPQLVEKSQAQATNTSFWLDTEESSLPGGEALSRKYRVFIGPKDSQLLAAHGLDRAIEYGWFPLIAKPLSAILHFFHMIVRNYGLAIVMLTVMVRGLMFPLGRKAAMNAQRMQELQPELKKINDMYKDNMEKRAKAMQELYAKHNFKPLAGCLPMFIQLPIFIGLYRCLSVDISLRQEPLIPGISWCSNLAGPDMLFEWSSWMPEFIAGRGTGWLGPYFNVLPMVTVGLFLLQQKVLMPKATDEQTRMTQNMMQVMTIFMGVLFFKVPSGLCIYFITSSLWSLVERRLIKRTTPTSQSAAVAANTATSDTLEKGERKRKRSADEEPKQPGRFQELVQLLEKPAVRSATQRGSTKRPKSSKKAKKRKR